MLFHLLENNMTPVLKELAKKAGFATCTTTIQNNLEAFARLIIEDMRSRAFKFSDDTGSCSLDECMGNAELQILDNDLEALE
jgi:hypothetical protein